MMHNRLTLDLLILATVIVTAVARNLGYRRASLAVAIVGIAVCLATALYHWPEG